MIRIHNLTKKYKDKIILNNFNCEINDVGITAVKGASGAGKTTLIRILSGLDKYDSGKIEGINHKKIALMFQEDRLFEHLTALENISLVSNKETAKTLLEEMELSDIENYYPSQLSGGMCRRISLARAMAYNGDILILDEPFKGLDYELKIKIINLIVDYSKTHCVIIITHDKDDLQFADFVINL